MFWIEEKSFFHFKWHLPFWTGADKIQSARKGPWRLFEGEMLSDLSAAGSRKLPQHQKPLSRVLLEFLDKYPVTLASFPFNKQESGTSHQEWSGDRPFSGPLDSLVKWPLCQLPSLFHFVVQPIISPGNDWKCSRAKRDGGGRLCTEGKWARTPPELRARRKAKKCVSLNHRAVHLKWTQHCKSTMLQFKKKKKNNKNH